MKKTVRSKIKGAVFVARDTNRFYVEFWSAKWGLEKEESCVEFYPNKDGAYMDTQWLGPIECKAKFNDYPEMGEAWLVYPCPNGKDFWWERVDNLIDFS